MDNEVDITVTVDIGRMRFEIRPLELNNSYHLWSKPTQEIVAAVLESTGRALREETKK